MVEVLVEDIGFDAMKDSVIKPLDGMKIAGYVGCQTNRPFGIDGESFENLRRQPATSRSGRARHSTEEVAGHRGQAAVIHYIYSSEPIGSFPLAGGGDKC
ncbi:MAG: hypothetical protein ABI479_03905 [Gallionella sp.]